jgi:threonine aldolase
MRFLSSQWIGLLESGAWLRHAAHANAMAARLARELGTLGAVQVNDPPAANAVFVQMPASLAAALRARGWLFYEFAAAGAYRLMCAWDTTAADVALLAADLKRAAAAL